MTPVPQTKEQFSAHIPALHLLSALDWDYLSPSACLSLRSSTSEVLLKPILIEFLRDRRFEYKGEWYPLSNNAIDQIVRDLSSPSLHEGLLAANERIYEKLTLGITVTEFMADGKKHQPTIALIDWQDYQANRFHVTEEMEIISAQGTHTRRPDVICFVNGIPLIVIEAKRPDSGNPGKSMIDEGVSQHLRNQRLDEIPELFAYTQLLLAVSHTDGRYGTVHTPAKFWARWRDEEFTENHYATLKNTQLSPQVKEALFADKPRDVRDYFEGLWAKLMFPTDQDRLLASLADRKRLLEFVRMFLLFDRKSGKIVARYPQFFGIRALIDRINQRRPDGGREGGVLWHTTGSGKSLTMVMLTKALLLHDTLKNCRFIVVTDRIDLEKQLSRTFMSGGAFGSLIATKKEGEKSKVTSGRDLARRIGHGAERIIFTLIHKFNTASKLPECYNPSSDLVVLVDEGHRSQKENHERMRIALPNAAFVAFTGTPILKGEKTTNKFGPIVHAYSMQKAVEDKTVSPLLYEERKPALDINEQAVNNWFDKITAGLSDAQKSDLKKKFARKGAIYGSENRIELIAWDIAVHFSENFKKLALGLKGQVATDLKRDAIRYKKHLDATGLVTSAVVISAPDTREGNTEVDETTMPEVQKWWKDNIGNNAENYERQILEDFATEGDPDLLIVVDKLLTGFDEPRNAVLYIDKPLEGHNLIQAIARVNRLHEEKRYGLLIDYRGVLKELDTAIRDYQDLDNRTQQGYDIQDIEGLYSQMSTEYKRLPMLYDALWTIFADVQNRRDLEQYRQILMPKYVEDAEGNSFDSRQKTREDFYEALTAFGGCLQVSLSSRSFFEDKSFSEELIKTYKEDLRFFSNLRKIARQDALETIDYSVYEEQIRRLVDKQVIGLEVRESEGVYLVNELGKAQDPKTWSEEKTRNETDIIRTRLKKTIEQDLADDPYAQKIFSQLLKMAIAEAEAMFDHPFKQYALFKDFEEKVQHREIEGIPDSFGENRHARAFFGTFKLVLGDDSPAGLDKGQQQKLVDEALAIDETVKTAVAENSLNPQNIEAAIRKGLLPRLFALFGLDKAKEVIEHVIQITRVGLSRERH